MRHLQMMLLLGYANFEIAFLFNLVIPLVPILPEALSTTPGNASWVVTAFFVTGAVASPLVGRLGDVIGRRRTFIGCALLLCAGSLLCAMSTELMTLVIGRILQGLALPILPLAMSLLREHVEDSRIAGAAGWGAAGLGAGGGLGLVGGGMLLDVAGWHAVFWCTLAISVPLLPLAAWAVPRETQRPAWQTKDLDLAGAAGLAVLLVCLLLPLSKGADWGMSLATTAPLALFIAFLPAWVRARRRHPDPVLDLRLLVQPQALAAHVTAFAAGFSGFMGFVSTAHALQQPAASGLGYGLTLTQAGLLMTPAMLSFLVTGPIAGGLMRRTGLRSTALVGGAVTCVGAVLLPALADRLGGILVGSFVLFIGNGILMATLPVLVTLATPAHAWSSATGVNAFARTMGTALASSVFAAALTALPAEGRTWMTAVQSVSLLMMVAMMMLTARRPRPRETPAY